MSFTRIRAQLAALLTVVSALSQSHPEKTKLLAAIDVVARDTLDLLIDSQVSDAEIALTKSLIEAQRMLINPHVKAASIIR